MSNKATYFSDEDNEDENAQQTDEDNGSDVEDDEDAVTVEDDEDAVDVEEEEDDKQDEKQDEDETPIDIIDNEDDDDEDEDDEQYLQKFDEEINRNYILDVHPECAIHNKTEVMAMAQVVRDARGIIIDELHRTIPFLTKYERTRIIGQRASQINSGSKPFLKNVPDSIMDGHIIATMELDMKSIPFIIRRPLPNGGSEYWRVKDLQNLL
jgi:DNA-directed RNA polymerase subunit K/omega